MSLAENNPNESHKQGANNICQIVLNFVPLDNFKTMFSCGSYMKMWFFVWWLLLYEKNKVVEFDRFRI